MLASQDPECSTAELGKSRLPKLAPRPAVQRQAKRRLGAVVTQFREFEDGEIVPGTRYRVERLIGLGGMGSVYEVEHTELGKRFVLKALLRELARREDLVARLRNEWRALARLEHPNIVSVTDAGTSANGVPFYVMERLEGETLAARLRRAARLFVPDALQIAAAVLDGLSAAHEIGVIHRDVKPPNVFLVRGTLPKLLDFGVAKIADASGVITARGIAIGTPRYMSPEQARGDVLDGRSDIYATGLILFEMIAGRGPFDDTHDANELVLAHITREAPRLSSLTVVAPELDALVASMLEKDSRARPENARDLAVALRQLAGRYAISTTTDAPTPSAPHRGGARPDSASPTRPDGVASRNSTPDAPTRAAVISTREVTVHVATREMLASAGSALERTTPTPFHHAASEPRADTVIDPLTLGGEVTGPGRQEGERTEMLGPVDGTPPNDAPTTRTRVPSADSAHNVTPPPVVPAPPSRPEPVRRRQVVVASAAALGGVLLLVGFGVASRGRHGPGDVASHAATTSAAPRSPEAASAAKPAPLAEPARALETVAAPGSAAPKAPSSPAGPSAQPASGALSAALPASAPLPPEKPRGVAPASPAPEPAAAPPSLRSAGVCRK
jgi:serine/threonine protein kinase